MQRELHELAKGGGNGWKQPDSADQEAPRAEFQ